MTRTCRRWRTWSSTWRATLDALGAPTQGPPRGPTPHRLVEHTYSLLLSRSYWHVGAQFSADGDLAQELAIRIGTTN